MPFAQLGHVYVHEPVDIFNIISSLYIVVPSPHTIVGPRLICGHVACTLYLNLWLHWPIKVAAKYSIEKPRLPHQSLHQRSSAV